MRTIAGFGMALVLAIVLSAQVALASDAQRALDEAKAALAVQPPQRDAARSALERATAATDDPAAVSEAYFRLGALDEDDAAFAQAVIHYRQSIAARPANASARWVRNAASRVQWLSAHSEGDFAPLTRLYRFKRDPALAANPAAIDALARDTDSFPPGSVRAESRLLVANAWLGPLHRPRDAIPLFRQVTTDPTADGMNLRFAERGLVDALIADGQVDAAMKEGRVHAAELDPQVVSRLLRLERRRTLLRAAQIEVAAFVVFVVVGVVYRRWRRRAGRAVPRLPWSIARVASVLWGAVTAIAVIFLLLVAMAPTPLERLGL